PHQEERQAEDLRLGRRMDPGNGVREADQGYPGGQAESRPGHETDRGDGVQYGVESHFFSRATNRATPTDPVKPRMDNTTMTGSAVPFLVTAANAAIAATVIAKSTSVATIRSSVDGPLTTRHRVRAAATVSRTATATAA